MTACAEPFRASFARPCVDAAKTFAHHWTRYGFVIRPLHAGDIQSDKLLAIWSIYKPGGVKVATGYNFVTPGTDGRFNYMAGFF